MEKVVVIIDMAGSCELSRTSFGTKQLLEGKLHIWRLASDLIYNKDTIFLA